VCTAALRAEGRELRSAHRPFRKGTLRGWTGVSLLAGAWRGVGDSCRQRPGSPLLSRRRTSHRRRIEPKDARDPRRRTRERHLGRSTRRQRPGPPFHGPLLRRGGRGARALHHPRRSLDVAEATRDLRPGGWLLLGGGLFLLEHVRTLSSPCAFCRASSTRSLILLENDHLLCAPLRHVEDAGLVVERLERSKLGIVEWLVAAGHSL
jgi:hypothetical protein